MAPLCSWSIFKLLLELLMFIILKFDSFSLTKMQLVSPRKLLVNYEMIASLQFRYARKIECVFIIGMKINISLPSGIL